MSRNLLGRLALAFALMPTLGCNALLGIEEPIERSATTASAGGGGAGGSGGGDGGAGGGGFSGGGVPPTNGDFATVGRLPDQDVGTTLTEDGLELGSTLCKGSTCVSGSIAP